MIMETIENTIFLSILTSLKTNLLRKVSTFAKKLTTTADGHLLSMTVLRSSDSENDLNKG